MGICPNCGVDRSKFQFLEESYHAHFSAVERFLKTEAAHAVKLAKTELEIINLKESMKYLQRKVRKQAVALKRLEEKLRARGEQPYD